MSIRKVKTAVVGCGMISSIYIRNLSRMFSVIDLAAVCNIHKEAAEARAKEFGIAKAMSIDELEADPEIELAVNLTPAGAHYDIIRRMLLAGKHVYTEKMFTTDLEKSRELVALAAEKGLYLGVAPDTVLGAGIQTARYLIDMDMIGEITYVQVSINRNQALSDRLHAEFTAANQGRRAKVLFESTMKGGKMFGYTENYLRVERPYDKALIGKIVELTV